MIALYYTLKFNIVYNIRILTILYLYAGYNWLEMLEYYIILIINI